MKCSRNYAFLLLFINLCFSSSSSTKTPKTSIVFTTLGRSRYQFDIYTSPITNPQSSPSISDHHHHHELKLTDGVSVNFNGHFPVINSSSLFTPFSQLNSSPSSPKINLVYVTERNGASNIYLDSIYDRVDSPGRPGFRTALEISGLGRRVQTPLLRVTPGKENQVSMKDRPSLVGEHLIYVSTHENRGVARASWAAVYSTHVPTRSTRRLTPYEVSDFSPAVSPSGEFTAVASYGEKFWGGEVEELRTDIYVFSTRDGSGRVKVVEHGGWPCWVDDETLYFHRRDNDDQWWSVYKAVLARAGYLVTADSVVVERVTPPGLHAFTPTT